MSFGESVCALPASVVLRPDGKTYVAPGHPQITVGSAVTEKETVIRTVPLVLQDPAVSPDGRFVAAGEGRRPRSSLGSCPWKRGPSLPNQRGRGLARRSVTTACSWPPASRRRSGKTIWNVATGAEVCSWEVRNPSRGHRHLTRRATSLPPATRTAQSTSGTPPQARKYKPWPVTQAQYGRCNSPRTARPWFLRETTASSALWNPEQPRAREIIPLGPANRPLTFDLDPSGKYLFAAGHSPVIFVLRLPN